MTTFTLQTLTNNEIIRKIILFHVPILFCLLILTDHETNYSETETEASRRTSTKRHLAVFTALSRHPPSMRVYRGLIELIILSFCASLSLYVWECVIADKRIIQELMFTKPYTLLTSSLHDTETSSCHVVVVVNADDEYENGRDNDDSMRGKELETGNNKDEEEIIQHNGDEDDTLINNYNYKPNDTNDQMMPTSTSLLNKSLDYLLLFLISLFLFTISSSAGGQYIDQTNQKGNIDQNKNQLVQLLSQISLIAAPIFPLVLFFFFVLHLFFPWNTSRYNFWTCISYTIGAPFYDVSFRDGFIGDIFTSMVRPMQDLAYTSFYLMSGLQGWWIVHRNNNDLHSISSTTFEEDVILQPVEHSWLLLTIILPACMVSPLWWRYCQTLRQCYETKKRWPYLGNALKYFLAAQVVILSVFFEPKKQEYFYIWIGLYVVATMYQILWDIFMDWEMFVLSRRKDDGTYYLELRKDRLYKYKSVYIGILILNIILRFGWILTFIPIEYLSQTTGGLEYTFSADFATVVSPLLACAEIIRRTMWGFLRFELEALKKMKRDKCIVSSSVKDGNIESEAPNMVCNDDDDDGLEMKPMSIATTVNNPTTMISFKSLSSVTFRNDFSTATDVQILWELCAYATIFMCTGIIAGIHREVL